MTTFDIRQIIPADACLKCDVCCRYLERTTSSVPYFLRPYETGNVGETRFDRIGRSSDPKTPPLPQAGRCICRFFSEETDSCAIYAARPFDCRLYPFMITYAQDCGSVVLAVDNLCPFIRGKAGSKEMTAYLAYLSEILESPPLVEAIGRNKGFINEHQENSTVIKRLENLSRRLCLSGCGLKRISCSDREIFESYFEKRRYTLSSFAFPAVFIWSDSLNILWKEIGGTLCVFAGNERDYFLLLPPLSGGLDKGAVKEAIKNLQAMNAGSAFAPRIENVPGEYCDGLKDMGFEIEEVSREYIYRQKELAGLKGGGFKSKRSAANSFMKNYACVLRRLREDDIFEPLKLYRRWAESRLEDARDDGCRLMIEDSYFAQKTALFNMGRLGLEGIAAEINGEIAGYSLGYLLNEDTFVVLFETADLGISGLPQFLFREFAKKAPACEFINTMGDCGLANLKRTKESYKPVKKVPVFTATLRNVHSILKK